MQLPTEGKHPDVWMGGYIKNVQMLDSQTKPVYAFSALHNTSPKGTGKVWRKSVYIWVDANLAWTPICRVKKGRTWRGDGFKVEFWPHWGMSQDKWSESWFLNEADAEEFMFRNWEFFV